MPDPAVTPAAPATPPPAAVTTPAAAAPPAADTPAPADAPFYAGFKDADLRGWAEIKKYDSPESVAKAAREAEKLIGAPPAEILRMPKADAKPEEWDAFYAKQGRPATPEEYALEVPTGDNGEFAKAIAPILHKAGVTAKQAKFLNDEWNKLMAGTLESANSQAQQESQASILNLKREWGNAYDQRVELGRRALREFGSELGATDEERRDFLQKLENSLGSSATLIRFMASVGAKLGEASFHDSDSPRGNNFGLTPEGARAAAKEKMADADFRARWLKNGKGGPEDREMDALNRIAASGGRQA